MSMKPAIVLKAVEAVQSLAAQGIAGGSIWWETATLVRTFFHPTLLKNSVYKLEDSGRH
ncbi:MAG: hypothetical protein JRJ39_01470 [Deltaproteobacteria bacterium]|nr:hypothetical protein [Deltaproteobacteria bacterium]MBW1845756.1 hypothetical protein [Deltaproteobacteria bacterium]